MTPYEQGYRDTLEKLGFPTADSLNKDNTDQWKQQTNSRNDVWNNMTTNPAGMPTNFKGIGLNSSPTGTLSSSGMTGSGSNKLLSNTSSSSSTSKNSIPSMK